jgi:hypothetical protein
MGGGGIEERFLATRAEIRFANGGAGRPAPLGMTGWGGAAGRTATAEARRYKARAKRAPARMPVPQGSFAGGFGAQLAQAGLLLRLELVLDAHHERDLRTLDFALGV